MRAFEAAQAIPAPKDPPQPQRGLLEARVGSAPSTDRSPRKAGSYFFTLLKALARRYTFGQP